MGRSLREARLQQGLTQRDLERATGLLRSHISRIENGRRLPSLETLSRLAAALKVSLYSLLQPRSLSAGQDDPRGALRKSGPAVESADRDSPFDIELREALDHLNEADRRIVLATARKMARNADLRRGAAPKTKAPILD